MTLSICRFVLFVSCIYFVSCKIQIVDLTHLQNHDSIIWPTLPKYNFTMMQRGMTVEYVWLEHNWFAMTEHMGTHIDAPAHFGKGSWRTQQIPIDHLMGPGVIINIKKKAEADYDYGVVLDDVMEYEKKYGRIPDGAIVMMYAGWYHKYPNKALIFNTDDPTNTSSFHFPGWHEDTVQWLINNRHIYAIGADTPSPDRGQALLFPVHVTLARENVIGIENAAYLDKIPEKGSTIFIPVLKIDDGSGGPTRLLATYDDGVGGKESSKGTKPTGPRLMALGIVCIVTWMVSSKWHDCCFAVF